MEGKQREIGGAEGTWRGDRAAGGSRGFLGMEYPHGDACGTTSVVAVVMKVMMTRLQYIHLSK